VRDRLGEFMWSKQCEIAETLVEHRYVAVKSAHDTGKARPLYANLPTPSGWTTMGQVGIGDQVFDEMGRPTRVIAKLPTWQQACFKVAFDDGTVEVVNEEHEWTVLDLRKRGKGIRD
jgi:cyanophycinase-like exopeptidase